MAEQESGAVRIDDVSTVETRHSIKAATLLYSAPSFILRGPIYLLFIFFFGAIIFSV